MQAELLEVQRQAGVTALFVTHDQEEAMALSNRIVVMRAGQVEQVGTPSEIYHEPANRFVAGFIGRSNFLEATVVASDGSAADVRLQNGKVVRANVPGAKANEVISLAIRPENISLSSGAAGDAGILEGTVVGVLDLGPISQILLDVTGIGRIEVALSGAPETRDALRLSPGTLAGIAWHPNNVTALMS